MRKVCSIFAIFFFIFLVNTSSCKSNGKYHPKPVENNKESDNSVSNFLPRPQLNLKTTTVEIPLSSKKKIILKAQIAETEAQQAKGLMFRKYLPESEGMLFVYNKPSLLGFYMANCYIYLDMIFMDSDKKIIGFLKNQKPMDSTVRDIGKPSQYVLEVNGGFVDRHHIKTGIRLHWED